LRAQAAGASVAEASQLDKMLEKIKAAKEQLEKTYEVSSTETAELSSFHSIFAAQLESVRLSAADIAGPVAKSIEAEVARLKQLDTAVSARLATAAATRAAAEEALKAATSDVQQRARLEQELKALDDELDKAAAKRDELQKERDGIQHSLTAANKAIGGVEQSITAQNMHLMAEKTVRCLRAVLCLIAPRCAVPSRLPGLLDTHPCPSPVRARLQALHNATDAATKAKEEAEGATGEAERALEEVAADEAQARKARDAQAARHDKHKKLAAEEAQKLEDAKARLGQAQGLVTKEDVKVRERASERARGLANARTRLALPWPRRPLPPARTTLSDQGAGGAPRQDQGLQGEEPQGRERGHQALVQHRREWHHEGSAEALSARSGQRQRSPAMRPLPRR
jgi:chromosome segregation ATPase